MTPLQRLQLRQSETRQSLNVLLALDELTDEQRAEMATLTTSMQNLEVETRAAIVAEGDPTVTASDDDTAAREMRALIDGASIGAIFGATLEHRATEGQTAELQQHLRLSPRIRCLSRCSWSIGPSHRRRRTWRRTKPRLSRPYSPRAARPSWVSPCRPWAWGEAVYPVLTTSATTHTPAENAAAAETTGAFSADVLSPSRLQASFFYSREDRARFAGMDSALRQNLGDALSDALDKQILVGSEGLLTGTKLPNHDAAAVTTYANYRSELGYARVDGKFAGSVGDIKIVMGSATYGHCAGVFRSANAGDRAALEDLMGVTGGVKVSAHVPAATGANKKQEAVIRLGSRRDMVSPIWEGVTLIPDEITKAGTGQIVITAVMLHAVRILRADGFYKQQTQHV